MKRVTINELNISCSLVSSYDDLKKKDIIGLVRKAYLNPLSMETKVALLRELFIATDRVWELLERKENHDQVWRLIQTLDWVWKGPEYRPIQFIRIRGKSYHLPDEQLHKLGTAEFVIATAHLMGFHNAKDDSAAVSSLAKFMATIARPKPDVMERIRAGRGNGDPREEYNSDRCDRREKQFLKVDLVTQILTAQWFNNAANKLLAAYGMAGGDPDAAPISQGIFVQDWERQVVKVAEGRVFGGYDQVMERPLADVLAYIELKNDEIRRKIAMNRNK